MEGLLVKESGRFYPAEETKQAIIDSVVTKAELKQALGIPKRKRYVVAASQSDFDAAKERYPNDEVCRVTNPGFEGAPVILAPGWTSDPSTRSLVEWFIHKDVKLEELR